MLAYELWRERRRRGDAVVRGGGEKAKRKKREVLEAGGRVSGEAMREQGERECGFGEAGGLADAIAPARAAGENGLFGTPKAISHDKNHVRARCTDPAPCTKHLCCGPKRNQDMHIGGGAGDKHLLLLSRLLAVHYPRLHMKRLGGGRARVELLLFLDLTRRLS
eukprot:scaffold13088_cov56-Phaeocystis_antarctica.AAC.9